MTIQIDLRRILREKGITSRKLARKIGITEANLSHFATGKSKAIRVATLDAICNELDCQPGDILRSIKDKK